MSTDENEQEPFGSGIIGATSQEINRFSNLSSDHDLKKMKGNINIQSYLQNKPVMQHTGESTIKSGKRSKSKTRDIYDLNDMSNKKYQLNVPNINDM